MVKVGKCALMHKKWTDEKKTSHCKSRDFLRKRRLKNIYSQGCSPYGLRSHIAVQQVDLTMADVEGRPVTWKVII